MSKCDNKGRKVTKTKPLLAIALYILNQTIYKLTPAERTPLYILIGERVAVSLISFKFILVIQIHMGKHDHPKLTSNMFEKKINLRKHLYTDSLFLRFSYKLEYVFKRKSMCLKKKTQKNISVGRDNKLFQIYINFSRYKPCNIHLMFGESH